jgi:hypothetical protein
VNHATGPASPPGTARREHWDAVYSSRGEQQVSWYQADPRLSAELITDAAAGLAAGRDSAVIDAGGGASLLAGRLAATGFTDVTVVDVSATALAAARRRPGGSQVTWINADLLAWRTPRAYQIWHDRAVYHFLASPADRAAYLGTLRAALPGGQQPAGASRRDRAATAVTGERCSFGQNLRAIYLHPATAANWSASSAATVAARPGGTSGGPSDGPVRATTPLRAQSATGSSMDPALSAGPSGWSRRGGSSGR